MEVDVKIATANDIQMLIKSRFDYFAIEEWEVTTEQKFIIESSLQQYFLKRLNDSFFAAFIEADNKIASLAFLAISETPANPFSPTGKSGTIYNVLTYPEYRKKGYATKVMSKLIEEAKRQNLPHLQLLSSELGKPLYEKLWFQIVEPSRFVSMRLSLI